MDGLSCRLDITKGRIGEMHQKKICRVKHGETAGKGYTEKHKQGHNEKSEIPKECNWYPKRKGKNRAKAIFAKTRAENFRKLAKDISTLIFLCGIIFFKGVCRYIMVNLLTKKAKKNF